MRLHSDYPFWMISEGMPHSYPTLHADLRTDVAIIGGGITGALVSHALCEAGMDVVVVDKRHIAHGSTAASTALLQYEIDIPLFELKAMVGARRALRCYRLCGDALTGVGELCKKLGGRLGFAKRPSLLYASYKKHVAEILEPEYAARRAAGIDVSLLSADDVAKNFGFHAPGGILSAHAAQVNPFRLTHRLLAKLSAAGGRVYELTEVAAVTPSARGVTLQTTTGHTIRAKYVVVATGYEAERQLPKPVGIITSSYAIVSKPLADATPWYKNALIWETRRPYHYCRTTADHRVLIGGRDEPFYSPEKRDALLRRKSRALLEDFHMLFPGIPFDMDFYWAGTFTQTEDGLPYIGSAYHKRVLYALGYSGNGITFSAIAADLLRDRILGITNPDANVFSFDR